jgi:acyl-CoA thioesterase-1
MKAMGSLLIVTELKHFQAKWVPVRRPEMRQNKKNRGLFRSYGKEAVRVHSLKVIAFALIGCAALLTGSIAVKAADRPVKIVALGDSLTAGYGLDRRDAFPEKLEKALKAKGLAVEIENAGVSGDTASGGLSRLDWSVGDGTDAVIIELGANDMLRGIDPKVTRAALEAIIERLKARGIEILLSGMRAAPNMGDEYLRGFDAIFPDLAAKHGLVYYPFFLDGVATQAKFALRDGIHPNAAGVSQIVSSIMPKVEELIARVRKKRGS